MRYLVGIDGGATKTKAILANAEGKILGSALKGPANYRTQGIDRASHLLRDIIFTVLEEVGLTWSDLNVVVAGLAGVHEDFDEKRVKNSLLEVLPDNNNIRIDINNDLYIALVGGIQKEYGIATNAGTGAIAIGINHSGETYISDGWGYLLGDEGSGFWVGLQAIKAALEDIDNRGKPTSLKRTVKSHFNISKTPELLDVVYSREGRPKVGEIAGLAPAVFEEARAGDSLAMKIIKQAGRKLARTTRAVIEKLRMTNEEFPLLLTGGIFHANFREPLINSFEKTLTQFCSTYSMEEPEYPPEIGSVLIGLRKIHGSVNSKVGQNLAKSWEEGSFYNE